MAELGIDVADRAPRAFDRGMADQVDVVVTIGCRDECPYIPGQWYIDWDLRHPKGLPVDEVRAIAMRSPHAWTGS